MAFSYEFPHPAVTVDVIVFTMESGRLKVLLIRRDRYPFEGMWALPGGFVEIDESLKRAAYRELKEETGVRAGHLQQLGAFGRPDRDPRERIITVAYYSAQAREQLDFRAGSDARDAALFDVEDLPALAGDHDLIVRRALESIRQHGVDADFALHFLPATFTMGEFQTTCECVFGQALDKRNFRKKTLHAGLVEATGTTRRDGAHRPAALYRRTGNRAANHKHHREG